ncbi:hypothetical protein BY996DRAFT_4573705 [Phakopsora pachyrhizi]|nr:hypothetical protein BY996DRAFT_4573705 [Phakopsora pachyrhizi]
MPIHPQNNQQANTYNQPQPQLHHHITYPALHLHPVNDTFIPKQIALNPNGQKVKIGRQTNQKTVPNATNGFFDSKVLSRMHAEVWTEGGKVLIRDVKSSNGTFINGDRLSPEGVESQAFQLHTDDLVEFGIDIIADDNKSIVHHKVATKVFLVMNTDDAAAAANFYRNNGPDLSVNRRASRPGVFSGGSFDHVLSRLQSELEKSRATGQELYTLNSTMNEIHDTLGGGTGPPPPLPPPYGGRIPNFAQNAQNQQQNWIQTQLTETQASLASHVEKVKSIEAILGEHEQLKREVYLLKEKLEQSSNNDRSGSSADLELEIVDQTGRVSPIATMLEQEEEEDALKTLEGSELDDDGDSASVSSTDTLTWKPTKNSYLNQGSIKSPHSPPPNPPISPTPVATIDPKQIESIIELNTTLNERIDSISIKLQEAILSTTSLSERTEKSTDLIQALENRLSAYQEHNKLGETRLIELVDGNIRNWKESLEISSKVERERFEEERRAFDERIESLRELIEGQEKRLRFVESFQQSSSSRRVEAVDENQRDDQKSISKPKLSPKGSKDNSSKDRERDDEMEKDHLDIQKGESDGKMVSEKKKNKKDVLEFDRIEDHRNGIGKSDGRPSSNDDRRNLIDVSF